MDPVTITVSPAVPPPVVVTVASTSVPPADVDVGAGGGLSEAAVRAVARGEVEAALVSGVLDGGTID